MQSTSDYFALTTACVVAPSFTSVASSSDLNSSYASDVSKIEYSSLHLDCCSEARTGKRMDWPKADSRWTARYSSSLTTYLYLKMCSSNSRAPSYFKSWSFSSEAAWKTGWTYRNQSTF